MSLNSLSCKNSLCSVCDLRNTAIYNFWPNVCESLKYMYTTWQEKITYHITVGILFLRQGSGRRGSAEKFPGCGVRHIHHPDVNQHYR